MRVEVVRLDLEFPVAVPEIVPVEKSKVFADHFGQQDLKYASALTVLIFGLQDSSNPFGMSRDIFLDDFLRAIGGAIVMNDNFEGKIRLLGENTVDRLANIRRLIVSHDADADFGQAFAHKHPVNSLITQFVVFRRGL